MKPLLLRVLAVSIGVAAGLASVELLLRILEGASERGDLRALYVARPDRRWLYGLRPGADVRIQAPVDVRYRINDGGFRDRNHPLRKPQGVFRIVALGDSVTFGYGVEEEESYSKQLEAIFARRSAPPRVEVLNFGVGGYNAYNEAALFEGVAGLHFFPFGGVAKTARWANALRRGRFRLSPGGGLDVEI